MKRAPFLSLRLSLCLALGFAGSAVGQILPPVQLPNVPVLPTDELNRTVNGALRTADPQQLRELRRLRIRELLRTNRTGLEADPRGAPILRNEVVALSPSAEALERARAEGFGVGRTRPLEGLDATIVVLQAPAGMSTRRALQRLAPARSRRNLRLQSRIPGQRSRGRRHRRLLQPRIRQIQARRRKVRASV